ncbi:MAG: sulfite exporter TauE/SafE family protein [Candidatus Poribacteria bacterium]|nr:sulfite exporter TauE/SafE family protein [Candidatus Poribacteria bacterium]
MENLWEIPLILVAGVLAGFLNTVAGGGSLLALPVLIFLGLPAAVANGTNRVALFIQNASAIMGFRRKGISNFGYSLLVTVPTLFGAWRGARIAIDIDEALFNRILAGVMIAVLFTTLFSPTKKLQDGAENLSTKRKCIAVVTFYLLGFYGGFIHAGIGFLIIAALTTINGFDLVRANAIKVFAIFFYTIIALVAFIIGGKVNWQLGLTLAVGNATGAWIGSHWAVTTGEKWIKVVLVVTVIAFAIRLVWKTL